MSRRGEEGSWSPVPFLWKRVECRSLKEFRGGASRRVLGVGVVQGGKYVARG